MIWAAPLLIAVAAAPAGGKVASTYDEAACSDAEIVRMEPRAEENCSEPPPPVPAVIDCRDARASFWVAEMIGSCDMPRPSGPHAPPTVGAADRATMRVCTGDRCGFEQVPARAPLRPLEMSAPALPSVLDFPYYAASVRLEGAMARSFSQTEGGGLERPPRAPAAR